jgi:glucuronate isomerase
MNAPSRYFSPNPAQQDLAGTLYRTVADLPLLCPHGHIDPRMFADPEYTFGSPTDMLLIPDHYILRLLYAQGLSLAALGIPTRDDTAVESDPRRAWQLFADHFYLFRGTPTGIWLREELAQVFGIHEKLNGANAMAIYDQIAAQLQTAAFRPRALFDRFNIAVLCTTDPATADLRHHQAIRESGWKGRVLPTFRPDAVVNLDTPDWQSHIAALTAVSGIDVVDYKSFITALEQRRIFFPGNGRAGNRPRSFICLYRGAG